jgi:YbbR domain-containing protein
MMTFLKHNLAWMLLSVLLSTVLWVVVTVQQNPDTTRTFTGIPVTVLNLPAGLTLRNEVPPVTVTVVAPRDVAEGLGPGMFKAKVDASKARAGLSEVPVEVESQDRRVRIEQIEPARVALHLEPTGRKEVPVRVVVEGVAPEGYIARPPRVTPERVIVVGPQSLVEQVTAVVAKVNIEGAKSTLSQTVKGQPVNASEQPVEKVTVAPDQPILVEVPIEQQLTYKTLPVVPQVTGSPALGYQVVGIMIDPVAITVFGDPKVLGDLDYLTTRPVDITGAVGDLALNTEPVLPTGVSLARRQTLVVRVYVSPVESSKLLEVAPEVRQVGDGLRATVTPPAVQVVVAGPMPVLTALKPQDVRVVVEAGGLGVGTHLVRPRVELPAPLRVLSLTPERVTVTIR